MPEHGAMAFTRKWSRELQAACLYAILDLGHNAVAATTLAREGQLPQLKPGAVRMAAVPDLPLGTVRDWARDERARRAQVSAASTAPDATLMRTAGRLTQLWEREVSRAEQLSRRGKLEPDRLSKLARAGTEIARLNGARAPVPGGAPKAPAGAAAPESASFLDGLASEPDSTT